MVEARWRRHRVGLDRLRREDAPAVHRRRTTVAPGTRNTAARKAATTCISPRSSLPQSGPRAHTSGTTRRHRATPGLHRHPAHHDRGPRDRRKRTPRRHAAPKNGFFYILDAATGELISRQPVREADVDEGCRHEDGPADRSAGVPLLRDGQTLQHASGAGRCARLATDGLQPETGYVYIPSNGHVVGDVRSARRLHTHPRASPFRTGGAAVTQQYYAEAIPTRRAASSAG